MRLIDADALVEAMTKFSDAMGEDMTHGIFYTHIAPTIDAVPVEWIPVSEQMPKEFKTVLVFALSDDGDHGFMTTASHEGRGIWYDECFYQPLPKVYAWMPLPKPYLVKF